MHSDRLFPRMTRATFRRRVVQFAELLIYGAALSIGTVLTALIVGACLKWLGVG